MQDEDVREIIEEAIGITAEMNPQDTDGVWLEDLTVQVGPHIKEWDIERVLPLVGMAGKEQTLPRYNEARRRN